MNPSISYARRQRSFAGKAPTPTNDENTPSAPIKINYRPMQRKAWKPSKYTAALFHNCFKNW